MKRVVVQTTNYVSRTSSRNACIRRPHLVCTLYLFKSYQVMKIQGTYMILAMPRFFIYVECQLKKKSDGIVDWRTYEMGGQGRQLQVLADQLILS